MKSLPGEAVDIMRQGNEALNAVLKDTLKQMNNKMQLSQAMADKITKQLVDLLPDEKTRSAVTLALSKRFSDKTLGELAQTFDVMSKAQDYLKKTQQAVDAVEDSLKGLYDDTDALQRAADDLRDVFGERAQRIIQESADKISNIRRDLFDENALDEWLRKAGLSEDEIEKAKQAVKIYEQSMDEAEMARRMAGLESREFTNYIPGMAPVDRSQGLLRELFGKASKDEKTRQNIVKELGDVFDYQAEQLVTPERAGRLNAGIKQGRKLYPDPLRRLQGLSNDDLIELFKDGVAGKSTPLAAELDIARLTNQKLTRDYGAIVFKQYQEELEQVLHDKELAANFAAKAKSFFTDDEATKGFLHVFDVLNNMWKRSSTVLRFPAFMSRNSLSNRLLMWQDGVLSVKGEQESINLLKRLAQKTATEADEQVLNDMVRYGVLTKFTDISEQIGKGGGYKLTQWLGKANEVIENQARISAYFTALNKGMSKKAAADMVNKALFDYSDAAMSVFERNIIKRLIPFAKWIKNNLSKQTRLLLTEPGKTVWLGHLKQSGEAAVDYNDSVMPSWFSDLYAIPTPIKDNGNPVMISTAGLFPQGDLELLSGILNGRFDPKDVFGMLTPILRTPLEILFNKDLYYNQELQAYPGQKKRAPGYIEQFGDLVSDIPGLGDVWRIICRALGIDERTKDGESYYYMNADAVKAMRDFIPWMNQIGKLLAGGKSQKYNVINAVTGVRPVLYDTESFAKTKAYENADALNAALLRAKDEYGPLPEEEATPLQRLLQGR
jgi:hypothetical protein